MHPSYSSVFSMTRLQQNKFGSNVPNKPTFGGEENRWLTLRIIREAHQVTAGDRTLREQNPNANFFDVISSLLEERMEERHLGCE